MKSLIAGVDEVGRGCLAGPVIAAAVILKKNIAGLDDSKKLSKIKRDNLMLNLDKKYPHYGLAKHKGYPTKLHKEMLIMHGATKIHRMSFKGVKQ